MVVCGDDPCSKPKPGQCRLKKFLDFYKIQQGRCKNLKHIGDVIYCIDNILFFYFFHLDPHNALHICKTLGVEPSKTIMVGDTPADTLMGQEVSVLNCTVLT